MVTSDESLVPCPVPSCEGFVFSRRAGEITMWGCNGEAQHGDATIKGLFAKQGDEEQARINTELDELMRRSDPTAWVIDKLHEARRPKERHITVADKGMNTELPKYPTGFTDDCGGRLPNLRGMTTLSGKASAGKSWFALGSAISASEEGWDVHYVAAESLAPTISRLQFSKRDNDNLTFHEVEPGLTGEELIEQITEWIVRPRTLLVVDSISTLQSMMVPKDGKTSWEQQSALEVFLMNVVAMTRGYVAIVVLSEMNAAGEAKGRQLNHRSNTGISFASHPDEPQVKVVKVEKAWQGYTGPLGFGRIVASYPGIDISDTEPGQGPEQHHEW